MSEIEKKAAWHEWLKDDLEDSFDIQSCSKIDFAHWSKMPYWSLDEAAVLILGKDPATVDRHATRDGWYFLTSIEYTKIRNLLQRAFEMDEIAGQNAPATLLEWADHRGIEMPEILRQEILVRKGSNFAVKSKDEELLKIKDEEIAALQKRIEELETLVWKGFDENESTYSKELAIAVKAHEFVSKNWKNGISIKKQISVWLQENYPNLSNEEKERIAKMCNWQKSGGAPPTP